MIVSIHVHCGSHDGSDACAGRVIRVQTHGHSEQDEGHVLALVKNEVLKVMAAYRHMHTASDPIFPEADDEAESGHDGNESG